MAGYIFEKFLDSIDLDIVSQNKKKLSLTNLFTFPFLTKNMDNYEIIIPNKKNLIQSITEKKKIVIYGEEQSGKTALAKIIYKELLHEGYTPLFLKENESKMFKGVKKPSNEKFIINMTSIFEDQYIYPDKESYLRLEKNKRVVIIDDFHKFREYSETKFRNVINLFEQMFGIIIFIADNQFFHYENSLMHEMGYDTELEINTFNRVKTWELIGKWFQPLKDEINENDINKIKDFTDTVINEMKEFGMPLYPKIILLMLQTINTGIELYSNTNSMKFGVFGYYFKFAIIDTLIKNVPDDFKETIDFFLQRLAYKAFKKNLTEFTENNIYDCYNEHKENYSTDCTYKQLENYITSTFIKIREDSIYSFKHSDYYYFYLAEYLSNNKSDKNIEDDIRNICKKIYDDNNSRIILYIISITKDINIIFDELIDTVKNSYSDVKENDYLFNYFNKHYRKNSYFVFPQLPENEEERKINKRELREELDKREHIINKNKDYVKKEINKGLNSNVISPAIKFIKTIKSMKALGQIVSNYTKSIKKDILIEIAKQNYSLGLRLLEQILLESQNEIETLQKWVDYINNKNDIKDIVNIEEIKKQIPNINDIKNFILRMLDDDIKFIYRRSVIIVCGISKYISMNIGGGPENAKDIYQKILDENNNSTSFLKIMIDLNNYNFKKDKIFKLYDILEKNKNLFLLNALKIIVHHYLLYNNISMDDKNQVVSKFKFNKSQKKQIMLLKK